MKKVAVSIHAIKEFNPNIIKGLEGLNYMHVDVMDGKFVKTEANILDVFKILKESYEIPIITHLMVKETLTVIEKIIKLTKKRIKIEIAVSEKKTELVMVLHNQEFVYEIEEKGDKILFDIEDHSYFPNIFDIFKDFFIIHFSETKPSLDDIFIKLNK
jgi:pentose-5-phosphate-3-epimerase